jgi:hypothetical protein
MNPEHAKELLDYVRRAADFTIEQAPAVAQEMLRYGAFEAMVFLIVGTVLTVSGVALLLTGLLSRYDRDGCGIVGAFLCLFGLPAATFGGLICYQIEYAPKLYLLERLADMAGVK